MSYNDIEFGDLVRLKRNVSQYAYNSLWHNQNYYVVGLKDGKIGLAQKKHHRPINWYKPTNFEIVAKATMETSESFIGDKSKFVKTLFLIVDGETGKVVDKCPDTDIEASLRKLLKADIDKTYVVYKPEYQATYPEVPLAYKKIYAYEEDKMETEVNPLPHTSFGTII